MENSNTPPPDKTKTPQPEKTKTPVPKPVNQNYTNMFITNIPKHNQNPAKYQAKLRELFITERNPLKYVIFTTSNPATIKIHVENPTDHVRLQNVFKQHQNPLGEGSKAEMPRSERRNPGDVIDKVDPDVDIDIGK